MAGTDPTFNADAFRTAIRTAMVMGQPSDPAQQVTFVWVERDSWGNVTPDSEPYDWTEVPTSVSAPPRAFVQINCAVEYAPGAITAEGMGGFDASRATLTLLDEDYANVQGADQVLIGGITYLIDPPGAVPIGLFNVTVYQMHCSARA